MNTDNIQLPDENKLPTTTPGNASNPPANSQESGEQGAQLLGAKAEKYLRESGNIEDMPDEEDWQDADETLNKENNQK